MTLPADIRSLLKLPAVCAPMFLVSGPALVREACKAGLVGGLPRQNARSIDEFDAWLEDIRADLDRYTGSGDFRALNSSADHLQVERHPFLRQLENLGAGTE